jgi:hypothetical protein
VNRLKDLGYIQTATFSLYLSYNFDLEHFPTVPESNIMFGTYNLTKYAEEPEFTYYNVGVRDAWELEAETVIFGQHSYKPENEAPIQFDVGSSGI